MVDRIFSLVNLFISFTKSLGFNYSQNDSMKNYPLSLYLFLIQSDFFFFFLEICIDKAIYIYLCI